MAQAAADNIYGQCKYKIQIASSLQECTRDVLAALQINIDMVTKDILSLKDKARKLVCDWLHQFCRTKLSDILLANTVPCHEEQLSDAFIIAGALMRTDSRDPRWHLLHVDTLIAKGEMGFLPNVMLISAFAATGNMSTVIYTPDFMANPLQVKSRRQALICPRCLAKSQEMRWPRPGWVWWRPGSRTTAAQLAGLAK